VNDTLITEVSSAGVGKIVLNKPERHNAFDDRLIAALTETIDSLKNDPAVRVIVLAASGKSFSAGADLEWMKRSANYSQQENLQDAKKLAYLMRELKNSTRPTIARVQGAAFGGGVGLVACCDIAIAVQSAIFCLSEVRLGLVPAVISPYVTAAIGARVTQKLTLTAERFTAAEAHRLGLLHQVVESEDQLDAAVQAACDNLLKGAPLAQGAAKQFIGSLHNRELDANLVDESADLIARIRASDEGREGVDAFLKKRNPDWAD
jgi:methylglutaconyl-CoA hydratase